ncbi:hypothetical protein DESC_390023 [Desulfosarcina cetonica]|nr:hypothetical protein DESC_390023 [Desulfosarcina cetonica]
MKWRLNRETRDSSQGNLLGEVAAVRRTHGATLLQHLCMAHFKGLEPGGLQLRVPDSIRIYLPGLGKAEGFCECVGINNLAGTYSGTNRCLSILGG